MAIAEVHPNEEQLAAFALGTLDDKACSTIETHVISCPSCQERAAATLNDNLVELLQRAHTRDTRPKETEHDATAQVETPLPLTAWQMNGTVERATAAEAPGPVPELVEIPPELAKHERYRVVRLLGQGGMGAVFAAEHRVMQRLVAVKIIHRSFTANVRARERFRREARAAAKLSHANIVSTYDAEDIGDTHFLVMEYVEGTSLAQLVKEKGPLPATEAAEYIRQAALGLQHAHERSMVHRDIKPANLIRSTEGAVKVLDFGLAVLAAERDDGLTEEHVVMGTPDYMAPEQAEDARKADIRSDIYSLGCTLYYLLTGRVPFAATSTVLKLLAHREQSPPALGKICPNLPVGLEGVVAKMLGKQPADRYQTPGEVAAALAPFTRPQAQEPPRNPRRLWLTVAAAALFSLLGLLGIVVYRIQTDNGTLEITSESDDVRVVITKGGKQIDVIDAKTDKKISLRLGSADYELALEGAPEGLKLNIDNITLTRGDIRLAKIERISKAKTSSPKESTHTGRKTDQVTSTPIRQKPLKVAYRLPWPGRNDAKTCFSEDSSLCAAWCVNAMRIFETKTGRMVQEFVNLPPQTVNASFLPDNKEILTSHTDGVFRRWDLATGKLSSQFSTSPGWPLIQGINPEGDRLCVWDALVQVRNLKTGDVLFRVAPEKTKGSLAASAPVSPDGKRLLTVEFSGGDVGLRVFDLASGKNLMAKWLSISADIQRWSPDGKHIYLNGGIDNEWVVARVDAETGKLESSVPLVPQPGGSYGRSFSRDCRFFAVQYPAAELVHLYDTRSGQLVLTANGPNPEFSLSFSPDGRFFACGGRGQVILYQLPTPAEVSP